MENKCLIKVIKIDERNTHLEKRMKLLVSSLEIRLEKDLKTMKNTKQRNTKPSTFGKV